MHGDDSGHVEAPKHIDEPGVVPPDAEFVLKPEDLAFAVCEAFQYRSGGEMIPRWYPIPDGAREREQVVTQRHAVAIQIE